MKKILSMVVLCALLLTALAVSSSAAAYFEQKNPNARITVKKTTGVTIDGIISDGEYEEFTDAAGNYTEWYVAENASDYFDMAGEMAANVRWFFSWDGADYFYIAAQWNAGIGANQPYAGGDYYDDRVTETEDHPDDFLGAGAGVQISSGEISFADEEWSRLYIALGENTETGEKITGTYANQKGQTDDYTPAHNDFDFTTTADGLVTFEYRIPVYQLNEKFVSGTPTMLKASIVLQSGVYTEECEGGYNTYCWGVRLGQFGFNCDSGNLDKSHATFRLVNDVIPGPVVPDEDTTAPDTTVPAGTTANGGTTTPNGTTANGGATTPNGTTANGGATIPAGTTANGGATTPAGTTANGGATTPNGTTANGGATTPNSGNSGSANRPTTGNGGNASQTADFGVVAALVSAISAAGVMISKKRK